MSAVQSTTPFQNPPDGTQLRKRSRTASGQLSPNGLSSIFSQGALILQFGTHFENPIFDTPRGSMNKMSPAGAVTPIESGQSLSLSSIHPKMHGRNAHPKASCYPSQGFSSPHSSHHRFSFRKLRMFLTMADRLSVFTSTITNLFDIRWQLSNNA
jgi:hypothetical protein